MKNIIQELGSKLPRVTNNPDRDFGILGDLVNTFVQVGIDNEYFNVSELFSCYFHEYENSFDFTKLVPVGKLTLESSCEHTTLYKMFTDDFGEVYFFYKDISITKLHKKNPIVVFLSGHLATIVKELPAFDDRLVA